MTIDELEKGLELQMSLKRLNTLKTNLEVINNGLDGDKYRLLLYWDEIMETNEIYDRIYNQLSERLKEKIKETEKQIEEL
jgi:predicted nuclease with TOPRIM domain